jgi:hypothetical protein
MALEPLEPALAPATEAHWLVLRHPDPVVRSADSELPLWRLRRVAYWSLTQQSALATSLHQIEPCTRVVLPVPVSQR